MIENLKFKTFEREDKSKLLSFAREVNKTDNLEMNMTDQMLEFALSKPQISESIILVYQHDKLLALGACMVQGVQQSEVQFEVVVHPHYRKQGIGSKLYETLYGRAGSLRASLAACAAKESMPDAVRFAQKRGFQVERYLWKMEMDLGSTFLSRAEQGNYSIRKAEVKDIDAYVDIMNQGFKQPGESLYNENSFHMLFANPEEYVFFIIKDGKIVSTAAVGLQKKLERGYIHNVTVYNEYRGQGFGRVTLEHCIRKTKEEGFDKAVLNVDGTNKSALSLYKKLGFREIDTDIMFKRQI